MSRRLALISIAAAAALAAPASAVAQDAYTTRIEPRPYYGAVITMESGVRVFRPLPPTRQVIVNPGGQTPLNLGFNDTRITENSTSHNYVYNYDSAPAANVVSGGFYGGPIYSDRRRGHRGHGPKAFGHGGGHGGHGGGHH